MSDLLLGGRWVLAVVLIVAGVSKLSATSRRRLLQAIRDYGVIPERLGATASVVLPWLEVVSGIAMCIGILLVITASVVAAMFGAFGVATAWHVARGEGFDCGCGLWNTPIGWGLVRRDLTLCALALAVATGPSGALAVWPGWASSHVPGSLASMIPAPLIAMLALLVLRLGAPVRETVSRRSSLKSRLS
jgi:uncharacterized membrane protein YphA (DoxX/SURF4 family)